MMSSGKWTSTSIRWTQPKDKYFPTIVRKTLSGTDKEKVLNEHTIFAYRKDFAFVLTNEMWVLEETLIWPHGSKSVIQATLWFSPLRLIHWSICNTKDTIQINVYHCCIACTNTSKERTFEIMLFVIKITNPLIAKFSVLHFMCSKLL